MRRAGTRLLCLLVWLSTLHSPLSARANPDGRLAVADRQTLPPDAVLHTYYLTTNGVQPELRPMLAGVAAFVLASSSRDPVLDRQLPVRVGEGLYRIDLRGLQWARKDFLTVLKRYPYSHHANPLIVRADWLVLELSDGFASDSHYRLLYGGDKIPQTRDEFLEFWKVDVNSGFRWVALEGESGVAIAKKRWIESHPTTTRGDAWGTRDSAIINRDSDPLEHPDGGFKHDAEEWIVQFPKISIAAGRTGMIQFYLLANGQGARQDRAPVDTVRDHTRFRGFDEVRNPGSCIQCHDSGMNPLRQHELRSFLREAELYADRKTQERIDREAFADLGRLIQRNNEDFATCIQLINGWTAGQNAVAFRSIISRYIADVTLAQAALELYTTPEELRLALALASATEPGRLTARLTWLAHGQAMPRTSWEKDFPLAYEALKQWRHAKQSP